MLSKKKQQEIIARIEFELSQNSPYKGINVVKAHRHQIKEIYRVAIKKALEVI